MYIASALGVILSADTQSLMVFSSATFEIKPLVYSWSQMCDWRHMHNPASSVKAS